MTALSADAQRQHKVGTLRGYPLAASTKIYKGAGVCVNSSGYAIPAADTASIKTVGVAEETVDNSAGSAGDLEVQVRKGAVHLFATASNLTQAAVGSSAYWADDNTLDAAGNLTNDIVAGTVTRYVSSTQVWLEV